MTRNLSIKNKWILIVSVPFLAQLVMIAAVFYLNQQIEDAAAKNAHAKAITDHIGGFLKDVVQINAMVRKENALRFSTIMVITRSAQQHIKELRKLVTNNPKHYKLVSSLEKKTDRAAELFQEIHDRAKAGHAAEVKKNWHQYGDQLAFLRYDLMSSTLVTIQDEQLAIQSASPIQEAEYRNQIKLVLVFFLLMMLFITVVLATYFTKSISDKLAVITANNVRLAAGKELLPQVGGNDEIAYLDSAFRKMATALEDAKAREQDVFENTLDMICSIDESGAFESVNPACMNILGYSVDELIGLKYVQLVPEALREDIFQKLGVVQWEGGETTFDATLIHKNGSKINVEWSAKRSKESQILFCVIHDVSERKEAEQLKQEVVAMVTHDLRSPLATIKNVLELLDDGLLGDISSKGKEMIKGLNGVTDRMLLLLSDLLLLERLKGGSIELDYADITVKSIFEPAVETVKGWSMEKNISFEMDHNDLSVVVDKARTIQVVVNLLSNAIKFSPDNAKIVLKAEKHDAAKDDDGDKILVAIRDYGRGIAKDKLEAVFERFQQGQTSDEAIKGGSGLGLTIVKKIVELHNCKVWVESEEGKGSCFYFTLPSA